MDVITIKEIIEAVEGILLCGDKETEITSVSTNSKEIKTGTLFVPIIGERVDAHTFIPEALSLGASAVFTSRHKRKEEIVWFQGEQKKSGNASYIAVKDTLEALQKLAAYYRNRFSYPILGITGSVGKTTTKEMISKALETKKKVIKTIGNWNSQVGLPHMMFHLENQYDIAVIEMGMSEPGEMSRLSAIARPQAAVITNIGVSHIGQLGSRENILREKLNIIDEFTENSILFVNGDDDLLGELKSYQVDWKNKVKREYPFTEESLYKLETARIFTYGMGEQCDYRGEKIRTVGEETHFIYCYKEEREEIVLSVLGLHNVANAIAALAISDFYGVEPFEAKKGLYEYRPVEMRGQIYEKNGIKIIDDTYNASPDSMKSGVEVLLSLENIEKRIAVLADVRELGDVSYQCHYEVGQYIAAAKKGDNFVHELITVGQEAKAISAAVLKENERILTHSFDRNEEAITYLKKSLKSGTALLVKGSRGMHTDEIVHELLELKFSI